MADKTNRLAINAPGRFYVDDTCIDCDLCRQIAPFMLWRDDSLASSYVLRQPESAEEVALAEEAVGACPTESIGDDG